MSIKPFKSFPNLDELVQSTIRYYRYHAQDFFQGTKDHDVSQNYASFLAALPKMTPLVLLDLGCGPGRDLKYFKSMGHNPTGVDACPEFCRMASNYSGCEVWQQDFLKLKLPNNCFDGIFANASLFHVPRRDFEKVLKELHDTLKPKGVLFTSNPRGQGEDFDGTRFGFYLEFNEYEIFLNKAGFTVLRHYYRPEGCPLEQQPWLAVVSRRG